MGGHRKLFCKKAMPPFGSHQAPLYRGWRVDWSDGIAGWLVLRQVEWMGADSRAHGRLVSGTESGRLAVARTWFQPFDCLEPDLRILVYFVTHGSG